VIASVFTCEARERVNVSNLDMSALPSGYIDATPVEATTLDGRKVSFTRRRETFLLLQTPTGSVEESMLKVTAVMLRCIPLTLRPRHVGATERIYRCDAGGSNDT
jgi:hypothetical protein